MLMRVGELQQQKASLMSIRRLLMEQREAKGDQIFQQLTEVAEKVMRSMRALIVRSISEVQAFEEAQCGGLLDQSNKFYQMRDLISLSVMLPEMLDKVLVILKYRKTFCPISARKISPVWWK